MKHFLVRPDDLLRWNQASPRSFVLPVTVMGRLEPMVRRILIATIGSLGDLNPFIGIGRALKAQGASVRMAVPAAQVELVRQAGLDAEPVLTAEAGLPAFAVARGLPRAQLATVRDILVKTLPEYARRLDALAVGADAIVASPFVLAAPIVAEKRDLCLIPALLQPFALPLPGDAPVSPSLWMLSHDPAGGQWCRAWNRAAMDGVCQFLAVWLGRAVDAVRIEHGLDAIRQSPFFALPARRALALYPAWFATDTTPGLFPTGFVRSGRGVLDPDLAEWLDAGPAPLVFTLGSLAGASPGDFPAAAVATAHALGRRAVLLAPARPQQNTDVIVREHIDYGALFPRAAAIVHHGGVGTVAEALAAGKPQMIVPHLGDQFDNAARVTRLGLGHALRLRCFNGGGAVAGIDALLGDGEVARRTAQFGAAVRAQDGANDAANAILALANRGPFRATLLKPEARPNALSWAAKTISTLSRG